MDLAVDGVRLVHGDAGYHTYTTGGEATVYGTETALMGFV